jgi:hypothetical protein
MDRDKKRGGRYIMGTGVDIPWVRKSIYMYLG